MYLGKQKIIILSFHQNYFSFFGCNRKILFLGFKGKESATADIKTLVSGYETLVLSSQIMN
jgi:hypothetical protein